MVVLMIIGMKNFLPHYRNSVLKDEVGEKAATADRYVVQSAEFSFYLLHCDSSAVKRMQITANNGR